MKLTPGVSSAGSKLALGAAKLLIWQWLVAYRDVGKVQPVVRIHAECRSDATDSGDQDLGVGERVDGSGDSDERRPGCRQRCTLGSGNRGDAVVRLEIFNRGDIEIHQSHSQDC